MSGVARSSSQIVTAFVQANQEFELNEAKTKLTKLTLDLKKRRKQLEEKQVGGKKKEEGKPDASKSEKFKHMDEHRIDLKELEQRFQTSLKDGLTKEEAQNKLAQFGKNVLSEKKKSTWYLKLLEEFTSFFAMLLWAGGILCFIAFALDESDPSNLYLGIVLCAVVIVTGLVTFFQNEKSESIMEAFRNFIPPETQVIRDGQQQKLQAIDLVPGDVVVVEFGKRIPADIRILDSNEMKVDNSSLTGESQLMIRSVECTNPDNPLETKNLAFFGTLCKEGSGKGMVLFTGDRTVIGQIANLAATAESELSPLKKELNYFIKLVTVIAIVTGLVFFVLGFAIGFPPLTNVLFAIGIIVANVPEGLLATVTVALTLTARKLAAKKVLVKNLEGVETLGSTSCICSDKTGTLTQNKMTVEHLWFNNTKIKGHNRQKMGDKFKYEYDINDDAFRILHECAIICSEALFDSSLPQDQMLKIQNSNTLSQAQKDYKLAEAKKNWEYNLNKIPWLERPTTGDASETALIKFFQPINDIIHTRSQYSMIRDFEGKPIRMPFNSTNKYAFLIVQYETPQSHYCLFTKGAPERIWGLCDKVYNRGNNQYKDEYWEDSFNKINGTFGSQGERVLGFAKLHLPKDQYPLGYNFSVQQMNFPFQQQVFCGLISLIDPPKDNVPYAVLKCKSAGIQVIMVTGDQPVTAAAIAKQCNIIIDKTANEIVEEEGVSFEEACKKSQAVVIHGDRLTKMAIDEEGLPESEKGKVLQSWLEKPQVVFARTSPAQKLIIVSGCQRMGHVVAVTGDGVNDSPAIKKADIGISMGITGSDVAKDAADMILLDDDFASIVVGIEEGRKIFDNLKKTIAYCVISNIPELMPFLSFIICQWPIPLSTVLVLCIEIGTDMVPSTGFVFEDSEIDIMTRKPRNPEDHLVGPKLIVFTYLQFGIITSFGAFLQWIIVMNDFGIPPVELFFLVQKKGVIPANEDIYDPASPWLGNSALKEAYYKNNGTCKDDDVEWEDIDWLYRKQDSKDLRMTIVYCGNDGNWHEYLEWGACEVNQVSPVTERPVCFTTEANKYAQTSYFFAIVINQIGTYFACQTLKISSFWQGSKNFFMLFAFWTEFVLIVFLSYCFPINIAFGTRDLIFQHFGIMSVPFNLMMIFWNEIRKYMILNTKAPIKGRPNWWFRCVYF